MTNASFDMDLVLDFHILKWNFPVISAIFSRYFRNFRGGYRDFRSLEMGFPAFKIDYISISNAGKLKNPKKIIVLKGSSFLNKIL